jgi:hypothetical protein
MSHECTLLGVQFAPLSELDTVEALREEANRVQLELLRVTEVAADLYTDNCELTALLRDLIELHRRGRYATVLNRVQKMSSELTRSNDKPSADHGRLG